MSAREFIELAEKAIDQAEIQRRVAEEKADMIPDFNPITGESECPFVAALIAQRDEAVGFLRDQLTEDGRLIDAAPEHIRETDEEIRELDDEKRNGLQGDNLRASIERVHRMVTALHQAISHGRETLAEIRRRPEFPR